MQPYVLKGQVLKKMEPTLGGTVSAPSQLGSLGGWGDASRALLLFKHPSLALRADQHLRVGFLQADPLLWIKL
jgi:hypothetical protein